MTIPIEEFMKTATDEQKDLLFKIADAAEKEQKLADEINKVYEKIPRGYFVSDGCIEPCEDEDDAKVITLGSQIELKEVREQIKEYMEKAVELGMHHLGLIQRNYRHYVGKPLP